MRWWGASKPLALPPGDDPDGVDDAREVAQQGQKDIQEKLPAETYLQKHAHGRQNDGDDEPEDVHTAL